MLSFRISQLPDNNIKTHIKKKKFTGKLSLALYIILKFVCYIVGSHVFQGSVLFFKGVSSNFSYLKKVSFKGCSTS